MIFGEDTTTLRNSMLSNSSKEGMTPLNICSVPPDLTPLGILYVTLMSGIMMMSIVGNLLVILAVMLSENLRSRRTFPFAASLAVSDMMMALSQIPFRISVTIHYLHFCFSLPICYVRQYTDYVGNIGSILNLFIVSLDRYMAIQLPYHYVKCLSGRRAKQMIAFVWMFAVTWGICGLIPWGKSQGIMITHAGWCSTNNRHFIEIGFWGIYNPILIVITGFYIQIFRTAVIQIRKIRSTMPVERGRLSSRSQFSKEFKVTKTIATVYVFFCLCWLPGLVITIARAVDSDLYSHISENTTQFLFYLTDICPAISMAINPIIYSFSNSQFRQAVLQLVRKHRIRAESAASEFRLSTYIASLEMFKSGKSKPVPEKIGKDNKVHITDYE